MANTQPDSRLYALRQINIWEWEGLLCLNRLHFGRAIRKRIGEHVCVRKRTLNKLNISFKYGKNPT